MVANNSYENNLISQGYVSIAGADETGCGSLIGDVYTCVLILPNDIDYRKMMPGLDDSKKKNAIQRNILYGQIKRCAIDYCIGTASVQEINEINIYWAKFRAFRRAIDGLKVKPDFILMDGNKEIPEIDIPQSAIVKGDGKSISIAAASIIAKVERDIYVEELSKQVNVDYGWDVNKGYYTKQHIDALKKYGKTKYHRDKYVEKFV